MICEKVNEVQGKLDLNAQMGSCDLVRTCGGEPVVGSIVILMMI